MSSVRVDLPPAAWRAMHSAFVDYLLSAPPEVSGALMSRLGGELQFESMMLAIHNSRTYEPHILLDEASGKVLIGLAVPVADGPHWTLFAFDGKPYGVDSAWVDVAGRFRLDEALDEILGGEL